MVKSTVYCILMFARSFDRFSGFSCKASKSRLLGGVQIFRLSLLA